MLFGRLFSNIGGHAIAQRDESNDLFTVRRNRIGDPDPRACSPAKETIARGMSSNGPTAHTRCSRSQGRRLSFREFLAKQVSKIHRGLASYRCRTLDLSKSSNCWLAHISHHE